MVPGDPPRRRAVSHEEGVSARSSEAARRLAAVVGERYLVTDAAERAVLSNDVFGWADAVSCELVVQPADTAEVCAVVRILAQLGVPLHLRGGGMSYTKGYVPDTPGTVLIDLRRLDRIFEINATDRYVVVGAGATWLSVSEALKAYGLKVAFGAPYSGEYSTVCGALAQGVPSGMQGVLAVEVVRADGTMLRTGAWGRQSGHGAAAPFMRDHGPDLTGMFLGDTGAFGIKTAAVLRLDARLPATAHVSFAFETYEAMAACMAALGPYDFLTRRVGLCPFKSQNAVKVGFREALRTLGEVAASAPDVVGGIKDSARLALGAGQLMDGVGWSMHLSTEAISDAVAEAQIACVRGVCLRHGREIPAHLPRAMEARGYSIRGFLGREGQRWVPTNSLWPLSRAVEVATAVQAFFDRRRAEMQRLGIQESYMTTFGAGYFLCEPSVYWSDEVGELHLRHLAPDEAERFRALQPDPEARAYVGELRQALMERFHELGAVHVQIGRFYPYRETLMPGARRLVDELKVLLDEGRRLAPGNLSR